MEPLSSHPTDSQSAAAEADSHAQTRPSLIVGIGASAGGLEALERFFRALPADTGFAFVVVLHLSPSFKSMMPELLQRCTTMCVEPAEGLVSMSANTVYVLTPGAELRVDPDGRSLESARISTEAVPPTPINTLFESLARAGERTVAVVLSGTGSDGSGGIRAVRGAGGLVLAQTYRSARFDGMPRSAVETGCVDASLDPEEMPEAVIEFARDPVRGRDFQQLLARSLSDKPGGYGPIFDRLRSAYDIDFNLYKASTIVRRIDRRLNASSPPRGIDEYAELLRVNRAELDALYGDLLIGVTRFFRDSEAFLALGASVMPQLLNDSATEQELRIWVCGCSTGEEAYSIGMLAMEAIEASARPIALRVLATDLHAASLQFAAAGVYSEERVNDVPLHLRRKYFTDRGDGSYVISSELRKRFIFSKHNVLRDPPFTRMDLVSCRNLLIYFQTHAQVQALAAMHSALRLRGVLFLGESESLGELSEAFESLQRGAKLFKKVKSARMGAAPRAGAALEPPRPQLSASAPLLLARTHELLLERYMPSGLLIGGSEEVLHLFGDAWRYVSPTTGRFRGDVSTLLSGSLRSAVLLALRRAAKRGASVSEDGIELEENGERVTMRITVDPLLDDQGGAPQYMVRLERRPAPPPRVEEARTVGETESSESASTESSALRVRELEQELDSLRERLHRTIEEVEAGSQELQAGSEELIASNEELQSTNEELHAVNEELYSVNAEHEAKIQELNAVTADLANLIRSTGVATLFLDTQLRVRLFTPEARQVFSLLQSDVGRDLRDFQPREPDPELWSDLEAALAGNGTLERELEWSSGRHLLRRIGAYRDIDDRPAGLVINYLDITEQWRLRRELRRQEERFRATVESAPAAMVMVDRRGVIVLVNGEAERLFGYGRNELVGQLTEVLLPERFRAQHPRMRGDYLNAPEARRMGTGRELFGLRKDGTEFPIEIGLNPIHVGDEVFVVSAIFDITSRKRLEARLRATIESAPTAIVMVDARGVITMVNAEIERLFGYERGDLTGREIEVLLPERFRAKHPQQRDDYLREPQARRMGAGRDLFGLRSDGTEFPIEIGLNPVSTDEGTFVLAAVVDLTERRRAEEELKQANEALTRSNLAQQQFIYIVSHDLREPINTINNFVGLLIEDGSERLDAAGQRYLENVRHGAERIRSLLDDLLKYVRLENSQIDKRPVDLNAVVDGVRADIASALEQRGAILECQELPTVSGQESMLRVLLQNLIDNATKFHRHGVAPRVDVRWSPVADGVEITVEDNGIGIDPDQQSRAFELFRRLHPRRGYKGTGIGLAMCKKIVELHGGRIWLESTPGVGTRLRFVLPATDVNAS